MKIDMEQIDACPCLMSRCPSGGLAILEPVGGIFIKSFEGFDRMIAFCKDDSEMLDVDEVNWDWVRKDFRKPEKNRKRGNKPS